MPFIIAGIILITYLPKQNSNPFTYMKVINFSKQDTLLNLFLSELRDKDYQKNSLLFRNNIKRIGQIMAYEISKTLNYKETTVSTPLDKIVLATVFRAGLPLHEGFLSYFDKAENAFVSAYRYSRDKEATKVGIKIEYIATPDLTGKTLLIVDPMLATGGSMELAYEAFLSKSKPARTIFASVIASKSGVEFMKKHFPSDDFELYCGAIDPILNEQKYIVPGLGDAGDLEYGGKL